MAAIVETVGRDRTDVEPGWTLREALVVAFTVLVVLSASLALVLRMTASVS